MHNANLNTPQAVEHYIYTSRAAYLNIEPAYLAFMGGTALMPKEVAMVHVYLTLGAPFYTSASAYDPDGVHETLDGTNITNTEYTRILTYTQLSALLRPRGQLSLKGTLVRLVAENHVR